MKFVSNCFLSIFYFFFCPKVSNCSQICQDTVKSHLKMNFSSSSELLSTCIFYCQCMKTFDAFVSLFIASVEIFGKTSEAKLIPKPNLSENSLTSPAMKAQPLSIEIVPRGYYVIWTNTHLKALCCSSTVLLLLLTHNPPASPHHALRLFCPNIYGSID